MKIAIVGASKDKAKFSNKAVRAFKKKHHVVFPVNPNVREIEGLKCYPNLFEVPLELDAVSMYVPPEIGIKIAEDIIKIGIKKVYLNPGAESDEIKNLLKNNDVEVILKCSIRAIGENPKRY